MKIVIVNGSPRKGNTNAAIEAFVSGAEKNNDIEYIRESAGEGVINNASIQERSKAK